MKVEGCGLRNHLKLKILKFNAYDERITLRPRGRGWYEWWLMIEDWSLKIDGWEMNGNCWGLKLKIEDWRLRLKNKDW